MKAATLAVGSMIAVMFMGSTIVTPLYSLYAKQFGFSAIMLTLIYAAYVIGNLVSLFFFVRRARIERLFDRTRSRHRDSVDRGVGR